MTIPPTAALAVKKHTLHELLDIMDKRDANPDDESSVLEPLELASLTFDKVDGYHEIISALEDDAARLKARAEMFKRAADVQQREAERIEKRLRFTMRHHNSERLPGNDFNAVLGKRKQLVIKQPSVDMSLYLDYPSYISIELAWADKPTWADLEAMPDRVVKQCKWDQTALREAFKKGDAPEELRAFVDYADIETFKWEVRKKV